MHRIALYHLETLLWISRLGTFAAAAERLNTTQPAVSARVREIEAQLGVALFRRDGRRMILTVPGRKLVQDSEPLWSALEQTLLDIGGAQVRRGIVRIGSGEIAAASCLPDFLVTLGEDMPGLTFEVAVDLTATMLDQLRSAQRDIVLLAGPVASPGIRTRSIGDVELVWIAAPAIATRMRAEAPWLPPIWSLPPRSPLYGALRAALQGRAVSISTCNNVRTLIDIIRSGGGLALVPATMAGEALRSGAVEEVLTRPRDKIVFQVAMRSEESDPIVRTVFDKTESLRIAVSAG